MKIEIRTGNVHWPLGVNVVGEEYYQLIRDHKFYAEESVDYPSNPASRKVFVDYVHTLLDAWEFPLEQVTFVNSGSLIVGGRVVRERLAAKMGEDKTMYNLLPLNTLTLEQLKGELEGKLI